MEQLKELINVLCDQAEEYADTVMPGYTHLQRAQPITFGHHLMAYAEMFLRDIGRMQDALKRMDVCPLGSGALAGTTYPLDRDLTAKLLGFCRREPQQPRRRCRPRFLRGNRRGDFACDGASFEIFRGDHSLVLVGV